MAEKKEWVDLGAVSVFDTDGKGAKRKTKKGLPYHGGTGTIVVNGKSLSVLVKVFPSRPGSLTVAITQTPDE